jgi:branched-chain amino acid transport system ATP-binding protein
MELLQVSHASVSFGGVKALQDVSLSVSKGEIFGLLGPNGAGKTTLFNAIAGVYPLNTGTIKFCDGDITRMPTPERCRRGIARTFQITQPFASLTVEENIMVGASLRSTSLQQMRRVARHCAKLVGLQTKLASLGNELSTGQRKRLELARALATEPTLILLDEITGGVDEGSIGGLVNLVAELRSGGMTIVLIEHNMTILTKLADRVLFMVEGSVLASGEPRTVMADPRIIKLYLG